MIENEKTFLSNMKLYFTTLFARTMPKVVIGVPEYNNNEFIFTNIPLEEIEFYEPNAKYYLHKVTLKNEEFVNDLLEKFTIFKDVIAMLYTDKLFSALNKHVESFEKISIIVVNNKLYVNTIKENSIPSVEECGEIISEYTALKYKDILNSGMVDRSVSKCQSIINKLDLTNPYTIFNLDLFDNCVCKCAVLSNKACISEKEFPKKAKITSYSFDLVSSPDGQTAKVNTRFDCDDVSVISVQPAVCWFAKESV